MWQKISAAPLMAYLACTGFFRSFRKDERGLSGVVVAVLLILVAVLAVVLIWGFLSGWLQDLWESIFSKADEIK
jgi:Flp pilus assembly pilin Flp